MQIEYAVLHLFGQYKAKEVGKKIQAKAVTELSRMGENIIERY